MGHKCVKLWALLCTQFMNTGLFLLWGGKAGSFVYLGPIGLGNGPHVLGNRPHVLGNGPHVLGNEKVECKI